MNRSTLAVANAVVSDLDALNAREESCDVVLDERHKMQGEALSITLKCGLKGTSMFTQREIDAMIATLIEFRKDEIEDLEYRLKEM